MVWPKATSRPLYSSQWRRGRDSRRASSVRSGVFDLTRPQRLEMRWTWVSTQMPGRPKASVTTRFAVLRPTPPSVRKLVDRGGDGAAEAPDEVAANRKYHFSFGAVEADRIDQPFERAPVQAQDRRGRGGAREQPRAGRLGRLVLGAQAQDASDEGQERIAAFLRDQPDDRRVPSGALRRSTRRIAPTVRGVIPDDRRFRLGARWGLESPRLRLLAHDASAATPATAGYRAKSPKVRGSNARSSRRLSRLVRRWC